MSDTCRDPQELDSGAADTGVENQSCWGRRVYLYINFIGVDLSLAFRASLGP